MNVGKIVILFGIFLITMYAGINFVKSFNQESEVPQEILGGWEAGKSQLDSATNIIQSNIAQIKAGGLSAVAGVFGLAFGGIFYIIVSLFTTFISIPQAIFSGINYLGKTLGIPSEIVGIVVAILSVYVTIRAIEFITGRNL